jgi:uncharacterized protein (TIGR03905 family)
MKTLNIKPQGVCSREMILDIEDDGTIVSAKVIGGCMGNLQGICRLIEGQKVDVVIPKLKGIKCRGSRTGQTSCPDQLAIGLENI